MRNQDLPPNTPQESVDLAALDNSQIHSRQFQLIDALTDAILHHLTKDEFIATLIERVQVIMEVDNVAILRLTPIGDELVMETVRGPEEVVAAQVHIPIGQGVAGTIAATGRPLIIDELSQVQVVNSFLQEHLRSLLGVPLLVDDHVIGVIHISTIYPRHFSRADVQLLQVVADRIALAIDHVNIMTAEQQARVEAQELSQQLQALQAINDILLRHNTVGEMLNELFPRLVEIFEVDNVAILLPSADAPELLLHTVYGPEEAVADVVRVPIGQGVAGTIFATGKPLIIPDLATSGAVNPFLREHFHSLMGVPLQVEDRVIGVIHASTIVYHVFSEEDVKLLQVVADRVAIAIDHAQAHAAAQLARKQAEEQTQQVRALNQQMENFLAISSHEMRTPLTTIIANLDLLQRQCKRLAEEPTLADMTQFAEKIALHSHRAKTQAKRLNDFITELLDTSRIQSNKLEVQLIPHELGAVVREVVEEQRLITAHRTIQLDIPQQTVWVAVDPYRIKQVITNYVTNALKFSAAEQPVEVHLEQHECDVWVGVKDYGLGIPEAEQEPIWDRFHQVKETYPQSGSSIGLGLGLFICKTIIAQHHGQVGVTSQVGEGATFWFTLPLDIHQSRLIPID